MQWIGMRFINIVAYIPVAKRSLCKKRPFVGNGSVNTFHLLDNRFVLIQQLDATIEHIFYVVRADTL
jgi:hypothetical protein